MERLDHLIKAKFGLADAEIKRLFSEKGVRYKGVPCKKSILLADLDDVVVDPAVLATLRSDRLSSDTLQTNTQIALEILHEDDAFLIVYKNPGIHCFPLRASDTKTILSGLLAHYDFLRHVGPDRAPAILHRLDYETEGILVVAKTAEAYRTLRLQFQQKQIEKTYLAICDGSPDFKTMRLNGMIRPHPRSKKKVRVAKLHPTLSAPLHTGTGFFDETLTPLRTTSERVLLQVKTTTGVRHQVRATLAALGLPIVGDQIYNPHCSGNESLALLATAIHFLHPKDKNLFHWELRGKRNNWIINKFAPKSELA